ncbi:ABC transporter ATP-binding protein [soil metagenome]
MNSVVNESTAPVAERMANRPLLEVRDLRVTLSTATGQAPVLRGIDLQLQAGRALGLIGESGCGKSMAALAIMGLLPEGASISGCIEFEGRHLVGMDDADLDELRGNRMAMVFQEPMSALNPLLTIGRQVAEPIRVHGIGGRVPDRKALRNEVLRLLDRVKLADAARLADAYPHQLSGGQRQRVTIAMALTCSPALLIADEPTTALDVTVQKQVLALLAELAADTHMGLLLITHDLGVVAENVDDIAVMYGGVIVESGPVGSVLGLRAHPYTRALSRARPRLGDGRGVRLATIPGRVPALGDVPQGCPFADRCPLVIDACRAALPALLPVAAGHTARCIRLEEARSL